MGLECRKSARLEKGKASCRSNDGQGTDHSRLARPRRTMNFNNVGANGCRYTEEYFEHDRIVRSRVKLWRPRAAWPMMVQHHLQGVGQGYLLQPNRYRCCGMWSSPWIPGDE